MGRFYQTARPTFVDGNIYAPPIELMQNVFAVNEQRTDDLVAQTELLDGLVDSIQHLNFDAENERVKALQSKYREAVDNITTGIYDNPLEYQKHLPTIKKLQRDMVTDKQSGEWYHIEQRYNDYQNWLKDNEKLREENPTLFNQLNNHWYNDVVNRGTPDAQARFAGQKIIDKPDLIMGYREHFENIKASASETSDGRYKIGNEWLSEDEVANIAWNTLMSDKNYQGYVNQMGNILGLQGYVDENGNPMNAFNLVNGDGQVISFDEYQKLPQEEKQKVKRQLNSGNAFFPDLASVAQTYNFSKQSIDEDEYGKMAHRQQEDINKLLLNYKLQGERDKENYKNELILKVADGDEDALKMLNQITAKETIGVVGNPNATLDGDYDLIENNREKSNVSNDGGIYFSALPGTTEYAAQQRRKNATNYATGKFGDGSITLNGGKTIKKQDYFDWLGDRKHTEETAKEFLQKKGVYQSASFQNSKFDNWMNNARWSPSWLKDDAAEDWDKIYELGNKYEDYRQEWYDDYSTSSQQLSFQPITNAEINRNMLTEIQNNPENFYLTDINGDIPKKFRSKLESITPDNQLYVTAANAHNEMGMKVDIDGEDYYIFPNNGNNAVSNLMTNLSMMGVDPNSQYFQEMTDRVSTNILHDLSRTGKNSKGTKSIVTKLNGIDLSLELVGDEVHLRQPDQGLNTEPVRTFSNMQEFTRTFFNSQQ
jgi:hypothetical protein